MLSKSRTLKSVATLITFFLAIQLNAQTTCDVAVEKLNGTYSGDCKKGKANGTGKAVGVDTYEGTFRDGYPDGKGVYHYANGDTYIGEFKKGRKSGNGVYHYAIPNSGDSVIAGKWDDDQYVNYDKPFEVLSKPQEVSRITFKEAPKGLEGTIQIDSKYTVSLPSLNTFNGITTDVRLLQDDTKMPAPSPYSVKDQKAIGYSDPAYRTNQAKYQNQTIPLLDISVSQGGFTNMFKRGTDKVSTTELQGVKFPFKAQLYFAGKNGQYNVEVMINKPGNWRIEVVINPENEIKDASAERKGI